jgi:hypothetical protein
VTQIETRLDRLIAEREPDPDQLERERLIPVRPYRDPAFYGPLEQLVLIGIEQAVRK